jgi:hypothetical protein
MVWLYEDGLRKGRNLVSFESQSNPLDQPSIPDKPLHPPSASNLPSQQYQLHFQNACDGDGVGDDALFDPLQGF